jgi:hypothetical protein
MKLNMKSINAETIYNLLDNGWIFVSDLGENLEYFERVFFSHLKKKYVKRIDRKIFVKKSEQLYSLLKNLGMDLIKNIIYDSIIVLTFKKSEGEITFGFFSLNNDSEAKNIETLKEISERILNENSF